MKNSLSELDLALLLEEARARTLALVSDLSDEQMMGARADIVNPLRWEIGHVAWFQERWILRHHYGRPAVREENDALYDSAAVAHDTRWEIALLARAETLNYMQTVLERSTELYRQSPPSKEGRYFFLLSLFHEYMHSEAITYYRQTLGYSAPVLCAHKELNSDGGPWPGYAEIPGGRYVIGSAEREPFVFDNEKWAHVVTVQDFAIARAPVTNAEYRAFVEDGGYARSRWWSEQGWQWRARAHAQHPVYWHKEGNDWFYRYFDRFLPLPDHHPVMHVNWYEADAYCRWAGARLPREAEWEVAAASSPQQNSNGESSRFPWGDEPPSRQRANLEWRAAGTVDVGALADGDSGYGCRQMIGNVWEWTADDFLPYPGFSADPYKEYSEPWFGTHKVLRGGCWATRPLIINNNYRNFFTPDRRDIFAGFRTCR